MQPELLRKPQRTWTRRVAVQSEMVRPRFFNGPELVLQNLIVSKTIDPAPLLNHCPESNRVNVYIARPSKVSSVGYEKEYCLDVIIRACMALQAQPIPQKIGASYKV